MLIIISLEESLITDFKILNTLKFSLICFYLFRLLCTAKRNNRLPCHTEPCASSGLIWGGNNYSTSNHRNGQYNYHKKSWHGKTLRTLVGALGTVAVFGLGTVFSETKEDGLCDEIKEGSDASTKKEEAVQGTDVVGTESDQVVDTRPWSFRKKQLENLSCHEIRIKKARQILKRCMEEAGAPGMVVGVTVNGKQVWTDGMYAWGCGGCVRLVSSLSDGVMR